MCTLILKLLPSILLGFALMTNNSSAEVKKLDLSGLLPFDSGQISKQKPGLNVLTSEILLVGGKEAMLLEQAFKTLNRDQISTKIRVSSITSPEFNLARIYSLFISQKIQPRWVIYLPSVEDEKEEIFSPKDGPSLQFNLQRGQTWWWQLLYRFWPGLALATLKKIDVIPLALEPSFKLIPLSDSEKIQHSLTHASLFKLMLEQWITQSPKTKFLLVSTPLDPNISPQNCRTSLKWPTKNFIKDQLNSIQQQNWDKALEANDDLMKVAPYYASTYYSRAKILNQLKEFESANRFLNLSWMMDCRRPYTALKNSILQSQTQQFPEQVYFYNLSNFVIDECFQKEKNCFEGSELDSTFYVSAAKVIKLMIEQLL
jgi:hypothetical protein